MDQQPTESGLEGPEVGHAVFTGHTRSSHAGSGSLKEIQLENSSFPL